MRTCRSEETGVFTRTSSKRRPRSLSDNSMCSQRWPSISDTSSRFLNQIADLPESGTQRARLELGDRIGEPLQ